MTLSIFPWAATATKLAARQAARSTASKSGLFGGLKRTSLFFANESRFTARAVLNSHLSPHGLGWSKGQGYASFGTASANATGGAVAGEALSGTSADQHLVLEMAAHLKGKPSGCEDAYFLHEASQTFGVADGVGGWAESGVDAGAWSRAYCAFAKEHISGEPETGPFDLIARAHEQMDPDMKGSSTVLVGQLVGELLTCSWVGDSSLIVIRGDTVKYRTTPKQNGFNAPAQLGYASYDTPADALVSLIPVQAGDIVVAATDGLFDNLFTREIIDVILQYNDVLDPGEVAEQLVTIANQRAHAEEDTPFAIEARLAGYSYFGGKPDDITVVVARVDPGPNHSEG